MVIELYLPDPDRGTPTEKLLWEKLRIIDELLKGVENDEWYDGIGGLDYVQSCRMIRDTADSALRQAVELARSEGQSWDAIARTLGVTRQSAHERYSERP